ncbi:MAG TPA: hypothetical protein VMK84_29215 [Streptosporangiaceae bacterium]|nr:hypothetical protein [Streptosporangiaceae bacterium]
MEVRIVLELLTSRVPGLRLSAGPGPAFPANISFRGPRQLWVDWPGGTPGQPADSRNAPPPPQSEIAPASPGKPIVAV